MSEPPSEPSVTGRGSVHESLTAITHALEGLREQIRDLWAVPEAEPGAGPGPGEILEVIDVTAVGPLADALVLEPTTRTAAEITGAAVDRVVRLAGADRAMLFLHDRERARLIPAAGRGFRREDLATIVVAPGEGVIGRAFREGSAVAYTRPTEVPATDAFLARFPVRHALAVPVRGEGRSLGVLFAGRRGGETPFSVEEVRLLLVLADRVSTACSVEALAARAADNLGRLRQLEGFAAHAMVGTDLAEVLGRACEMGIRLVPVRVAAVALAGEEARLRVAAAVGLDAPPTGIDDRQGLAGDVRTAERPVAVPDLAARAGPSEPFLAEAGARGCLAVPLRVHGRAVGVLYLADTRPREFAPEEIEAAQVLASLTALAVENDRLYHEIRQALDTVAAAQDRLIQTEKMQGLGAMAAGIAHEFNNILAIILGKTQLLLTRPLEEATREGLGQVEEAAWRAADIVRRLQGFAATRLDESSVPVEVNTLVHDAVTLTRGLWKDEAEARGISIEVLTDLEDVPVVRGNAAELREAVTNVILNAIDAMPRGGRLRISTRAHGGGVRLVVSDSGEGMSEETRRRVFDPFFSTRTPGRAGLGLSVVHGIVSRHRGRIDVASEEGRGTVVTLWLPPTPAGPAPAPVRPDAPPRATAPASILVLEDEAPLRDMLVDALARAGHTVVAAGDGLTGLARFQGGRFDLVLTDLSLPERSGLDVGRAVKHLRPGTPVVLMTGWGNMLDPARLRESGIEFTVVKPFRLERVLAIVAEALDLRGPA